MNKKLINMLKAFRNSLGDEAKELAAAITAAISEMESAEEVLTVADFSNKIEEVLKGYQTSEEVENKFNAMLDKVKLEIKNDMPSNKKNAYLDTPEATQDFINSILGVGGDGQKASERWRAKLVKNAVSGIAFPTEIIAGIFTKWEEMDDLLSRIPKVSEIGCKLVYTDQDQHELKLFAKGHKKGAVKIPSTLELDSKTIDLQFVYVDQVIDRIDLQNLGKGQNNTLLKFIIEQGAIKLRESIIYTILFGNDNQTTATSKITSLEMIGSKAVTDAFTVVANAAAADIVAKDIITLLDSMKGTGHWLYTSKANRTKLREFVYATGGTTGYKPVNVLADDLNVERIEVMDALPDGVEAVLIDPSAYRLAGGNMFTEDWTIYEKNQEAFRSEIAIGGAIGGLLSTGVLLSKATAG